MYKANMSNQCFQAQATNKINDLVTPSIDIIWEQHVYLLQGFYSILLSESEKDGEPRNQVPEEGL